MRDMVDPAQIAIEEDLQSGAVLDGVENGSWRIEKLDWPILIVAVTAGNGGEFGMRLDVAGYPTAAPAGTPWHLGEDRPLSLAELPSGPASDIVFRGGWSQSQALTPYMATERLVIQRDHIDWAAAYPTRAWNTSRTVAFYLAELHKELRGCSLPEVAS